MKNILLAFMLCFSVTSVISQTVQSSTFRGGIQDYANLQELRNTLVVPKKGDKVFVLSSKLYYVWESLSTVNDDGDLVIKQNNLLTGRFINYTKNFTLAEKAKLNALSLTVVDLTPYATKQNPTFIGNRVILESPTPTIMMRNTLSNADINAIEVSQNQEVKIANGAIIAQGNGGSNTIYVQNNNGNVGLGINLPTSKLSVNGSIGFGLNATKDLQSILDTKASLLSPVFSGTVTGINASMIGLPNVENTSDINKIVSIPVQTALNLKANQTAISNINNTSDLNKPVSTATQAGLDLKLSLSGGVLSGDISNTSTGFIRMPVGTTAQRPAFPLNGMRRYNIDTNRDEFYADGAWRNHARLDGDIFTGNHAFTGANLMVGTTINAGFRLDVNGTARFANQVIFDARIISADIMTGRIIQNVNTFRSAGEATSGIRHAFLSYTNTDNTIGSVTTPHLASSAFGTPMFAAANATQTYTNASTLFINGSPIAGTNAVIANAFSLFVNSGNSFFGGNASFTNSIGIGTTAPTHSLTLGQGNTGVVSYRTADQTVNFERVRQFWSSTDFLISSENAGTGIKRNIVIDAPIISMAGASVTATNYTATVLISTPNLSSTADNVAMGLSTRLYSTIPNALSIGTNTSTHTSGSFNPVRINPTYNQVASTASNTDLLVNRTETSIGSGVQRLLDLQVGGNSRFSVDNAGTVTLVGNITKTSPLIISAPSLIELQSNVNISNSFRVQNHLFIDGVRTLIGGNVLQNTSAILEVLSTTMGFLSPRMTTTQINAIVNPANGLQCYNTTLNTICFYNGTSWQRVTSTGM